VSSTSLVSLAKLGLADLVYTCQDDKLFILYIANEFAQDMNIGIVCVIVASSLSRYLVSSSVIHHAATGHASPSPSSTSFFAPTTPPFHGSMNNPVDSVSEAEPGVSTTEVSSVLSSSCMASSLEKELRERLLPDDEVCRLRGGGFSAGSLCSTTDSVKLGDTDSDPRLAKAVGGIRRRKDDGRGGGECSMGSE